MKKTITIALAIALAFVPAQTAAAETPEPLIRYETSVLRMPDQTNQVAGIEVRLTLPNYVGTIDATLQTPQGTAETEVQVLYVPDDMWDGSCYYSAVQARIVRYGLHLFTGSTGIITWKDLYSYGFLPFEGGTSVFSPDSAEIHFLQGPGLYTALVSMPYSTTNTGYTLYTDALLNAESELAYTGIGLPFVLALDDSSIEYFLEYGRLDGVSEYQWPGLRELLLSAQVIETPADETDGLTYFVEKNIYSHGMFLDIPYNLATWYEPYVEKVVRTGLMKGNPDGTFRPENEVRLSEVIAMASRLHNIYNGGSGNFTQGPLWYSIYVNYAISKGIIKENEFDNYERFATRAEMAHIFASAVRPEALKEINPVFFIRDVKPTTAYGADIFTLYRAGVLTGYPDGTFRPPVTISRSECAAIISRIADRDLRIIF